MLTYEDNILKAGKASRKKFGRRISFHVPGMFRYDDISGKYQAISITGEHCVLQCDHCQGKLLQSMIWATTAKELVQQCTHLYEKGNIGVLLSGGCDEYGRLPWHKFIPAIWEIKQKTGLYISVHGGMLDRQTAFDLRAAGVDQVLIDVIGDDETLQRIYHVTYDISRITDTLEALFLAGLDVVPHIVCGLFFGNIKGERNAVDLISEFPVRQSVVISMMRIPGTPSVNFRLPAAGEVADLIAHMRFTMPETEISLGCARERGNREMETMAIDAGVNRMALPSDEAVAHARMMGLEITFQPTCCSVPDIILTG
jgi:lipoyl synthase